MQVQNLTRLFKALGDPTRLRLLRLMAETELSVMELAEVTQLAQSRISNHLKILREDGLIQERREGPWRHYRLDRDRLPEGAREVLDPVERAWEADTQFLADRTRLEKVLSGRKSRNGRFFDRIADDWDDVRANLFGDSIARDILRAFVPEDITVADIGAGTGYVLELFAGRPRRMIAIDSSTAMLAVARRKAKAHGWTNVEFRRGDAHEPPLEDGEADIVTMVMVLQYLAEPKRAIRAGARALASGGRLIIADFAQHQEVWLRETMQHRWLGFTREELGEWCADAGLRITGVTVLPGRPWETPDGRKVNVPDGFALLAQHEPQS